MKRIISGIFSFSSVLTGMALIFLPIRPACAASWMTNGPMNCARYYHTATLLPDGKVLVTGGYDTNSSPLSCADLYDPGTGTWTATAAMSAERVGNTATLLPNGMTLVVGGVGNGAPMTAELFNPNSGTWKLTGNPNLPRLSHTATLLPNGKVLIVGGDDLTYRSVSSAELYDPATGQWTTTGSMITGHTGGTATLLPNGKVLVTGGVDFDAHILCSAELYDPASGMWMATDPMSTSRYAHTATLLPSGKVLVTGGFDTNGFPLACAELYDPATRTWTATGAMNAGRFHHTATLLSNGSVLVAGGTDGNDVTNCVEIYDSISGTWEKTDALGTARLEHTATLLPDGKVLITGGYKNYQPLSSTEVYDPTINPATGTNTVTGAMRDRRFNHQAILLPNGKVLVAGGEGSSLFSYAELFSPSNGTWTMSTSMTRKRDWGFTLTLLPDGTVLAKGGYDYSSFLFQYDSELYNPATGSWTGISPPESDQRVSHSATLLPNGKVLVAGGLNRWLGVTCFASAALYNPGTKTWALAGAMRSARWGQVATLLPTGKVLVAGGAVDFDWNQYVPVGITNSAELYDPASGTWTNTGAMNAARIGHTATLLPNGKVLVSGGGWGTTNAYLSSAELYDPIAGTWTITGAMNNPHGSHSATLLSNGKVMVAGGNAGTNYLSSVELYDPATGTWTLSGNLNFARRSHTATLLPSGKVLIAGGYNGNFAYPTNHLSSTELYDGGLGYSNAWKPRIMAVTSTVNLGGSLVVTGAQFRGVSEGSSGNTQDSSTDYPLVQLRSIESGQTVFLSSTNWGTNSFTSLPVWNFPPGYALATVFVNGIQSTSSIVNISVPVPAPTILACTAPTNGAFQFCFTNNPGALFGVLATTNLSLPLANWTRLSGITEIGPGHFQFSDPQTTNNAQRFYSLFAP